MAKHEQGKKPISERQASRYEATRKLMRGEVKGSKFEELERRYEGNYNSYESGTPKGEKHNL
jgi:hypothetical protein